MNIEEFTNIALSAFGELPEPVKANLNLGITVIPDAKSGSEGLTYVLGEYFTDPMIGRGIRLFYGSFMATMGNLPPQLLNREIIKTVKHEIRHHVEISAGVDYLGKEDRIKMARIKERFGLNPNVKMIERNLIKGLISTFLVIAALLILIFILLAKFND